MNKESYQHIQDLLSDKNLHEIDISYCDIDDDLYISIECIDPETLDVYGYEASGISLYHTTRSFPNIIKVIEKAKKQQDNKMENENTFEDSFIDQWSNSRETSFEIAEAIFSVARNKWIEQEEKHKNTILDLANWIWEEGISYREVLHIAFKRSTENSLFWGEETFTRSEVNCFWF